jgi:hypothetical protein
MALGPGIITKWDFPKWMFDLAMQVDRRVN